MHDFSYLLDHIRFQLNHWVKQCRFEILKHARFYAHYRLLGGVFSWTCYESHGRIEKAKSIF